MSYQCLACNEFSDDVIGADTSYEICYDCYGIDGANNPELIKQIEQFLSDNSFINEVMDDTDEHCLCEDLCYRCEECIVKEQSVDNSTNNTLNDSELSIDYDEYFDIDKYLDTHTDYSIVCNDNNKVMKES